MLGENIKKARNLCGFTQEQLAKKAEIHRVNLAHFESGTKTPSLAVIVRIADELSCSIDWLLGRDSSTILPCPTISDTVNTDKGN